MFYLFAVTELPCFPPSLSAIGGATVEDAEIVRRAAAWKVSTTDFSVVDNCDATDAIVVRQSTKSNNNFAQQFQCTAMNIGETIGKAAQKTI